MSHRIGVAFVGTGGFKMVRALRSFRRAEPDLPVHIVFDTSTNSWRRNSQVVGVDYFTAQPDVLVNCITNTAYVNGAFNAAIAWLESLGYSHACLFHDDTIFSPLAENRGHVSRWFGDPVVTESSGVTLGFMEALVPSNTVGVWERHPDLWDGMDLEDAALWRVLCPGGVSAMYFGSPGSDHGVAPASDWFVKYFVTDKTCVIARLGPTGFILPIATWRKLGQFDERHGIYYDMEYPVLCAIAGLPPVRAVSSVPHIHLHNQSTAFGDPAVGLWGRDLPSFIDKYGDEPGTILQRHGYYTEEKVLR